jgi:acetylornithine deacetylase/succinyl-diaminopimelate desuccinylase-like protein
MTTPHQYAVANADAFLNQLIDLLKLPSISAFTSTHSSYIRQTAEWIADNMRAFGVPHVKVMPTAGNPVVYGEWLGAGADKPTVLFYGHYDVQPADKAQDGWTSEPFEPEIRTGFIYARGSADDKGQMFIHLKAVESYFTTVGAPPINIKFLIEGEEEVGSQNLQAFIIEHADLLKADVCAISDTGMERIEQPAIINSVRGLTYMEIHVWGPDHDLHSGQFGGVVHNPALALVEMLGKMHNPDHSIAIPGFYDDVQALTEQDRAEMAKTELSEDEIRTTSGVPQTWGEAAFIHRERVGARPTFEINGLYSGHIAEGAKTVLPARALAKVSCRLVANQDSLKIYELVKAYIARLTPPTVYSEVRLLNRGEPAATALDTPYMQAAVRAYEKSWGARPIFVREGGSIPVVADFQRLLHIPVIMMGFALNSAGAHGPDEHFSVEMFHRGIATMITFLDELAHG